jgi:hypothetical protein
MSELETLKLKQRIIKMESAIKSTLHYIGGVEAETSEILSQRSGVPRGRWAFVKGAAQVARCVKNYLERGLL